MTRKLMILSVIFAMMVASTAAFANNATATTRVTISFDQPYGSDYDWAAFDQALVNKEVAAGTNLEWINPHTLVATVQVGPERAKEALTSALDAASHARKIAAYNSGMIRIYPNGGPTEATGGTAKR